jgi:hypothetical protein
MTGWQAYVSVMGRLIVDGQKLTGEELAVIIPEDIPTGFHAIQVDISHLHRRTFFFEVIA